MPPRASNLSEQHRALTPSTERFRYPTTETSPLPPPRQRHGYHLQQRLKSQRCTTQGSNILPLLLDAPTAKKINFKPYNRTVIPCHLHHRRRNRGQEKHQYQNQQSQKPTTQKSQAKKIKHLPKTAETRKHPSDRDHPTTNQNNPTHPSWRRTSPHAQLT